MRTLAALVATLAVVATAQADTRSTVLGTTAGRPVEQAFAPPTEPIATREPRAGAAGRPSSAPALVAAPAPTRSLHDCAIDFDDEDALNLFTDKAATTFAPFPFWNQVCNVDVSAHLRPHHIDHFHLNYEGDTCIDAGAYGEMQPDGSCVAFADPALEPRYLASMLPRDVIELTARRNHDGTRISFDLERLRVVGNSSVRVCYKPDGQTPDGEWITTAIDAAASPGTWLCWNDLPTGYWDLSAWATDVSAVRLLAADGEPNFQVDDILIDAPPY